MQTEPQSRSHGVRTLALHSVLLAGAGGATIGALSAWREVQLQGYDVFGLWRTTFAMLARESERSLVLAATSAAVLALVSSLAWFEVRPTEGGRIERIAQAAFAAVLDLGSFASAVLASLACLAVLVVSKRSIEWDEVALAAALVALAGLRVGFAAEIGAPFVARAASFVFAPAALFLFVRRAQLALIFRTDSIDAARAIELSIVVGAIFFAWPVLYALRLAPSRRAWHVGVCLALELALLVPVAFAFVPPPASSIAQVKSAPSAPNVIVIGIDTLRADHVAFLGPLANGRDTTPNLRQLAERGTVFTGAIAQAPWTMASFGSIFTGKYPFEHGAISKEGELRKSEVTLAEVLREAGYDTGAVVSHVFVSDNQGFSQGYDFFDKSNVKGEDDITSEGVTNCALGWLKRKRTKPFFLFTHYFDPHYEYRDHPESTYADGYDGWLKKELQIQNVRHKRHWLADVEKKWLVDLYDEEIVHTDREIGRMLDHLAKTGADKNTWIVVVGDHGEEFFEHGWIGHSITLFDEVLHVPLLIVPPVGGAHEKIIDEQVETRSVFATALDAAGVKWDVHNLGPSLLSFVNGAKKDATERERIAYSCVWTPDAKVDTGLRAQIFSLRTPRWKLIWDQARGVKELFDLQKDPGELTDVSQLESTEFSRLFALLQSWSDDQKKQLPKIPYRKITGAEAVRLHELGYM